MVTALHSFEATQVERRIRTGSSLPVVVETAGGAFVAKLRGAGHGVLALVAEIIVAEIAELLGLPVPERALIELGPDVPTADRNDELADLLRASVGVNVGFRFLDGAREPRDSELRALDDEFVARVLWLDGLTMNPDRTDRNPNILIWKNRPWLIDHGSALPFHYDWAQVTEDSPREPFSYAAHVFADRRATLGRFDGGFAALLSRKALEDAVSRVPESLLEAADRPAYHAFLWKRLKAPRPFVELG